MSENSVVDELFDLSFNTVSYTRNPFNLSQISYGFLDASQRINSSPVGHGFPSLLLQLILFLKLLETVDYAFIWESLLSPWLDGTL